MLQEKASEYVKFPNSPNPVIFTNTFIYGGNDFMDDLPHIVIAPPLPKSPKIKKGKIKEIKFDWKNWNFGGRIIFVAGCVAMTSMFMKWVDIGIVSQTGFSQGTFILLGLWVYPILMLFKNKVIHQVWGLVCSITSVVLSINYIASKSVDVGLNRVIMVNVAATGAYLFMLASIALIVGIVKYKPIENNVEKDANLNMPD
jgi:hypothetical protein